MSQTNSTLTNAMLNPRHGQANPLDPGMIWDVNHGRYIQRPGTFLNYNLAQGGFMQTANDQQQYSNALLNTLGGGASQYRPPALNTGLTTTTNAATYAPQQFRLLTPPPVNPDPNHGTRMLLYGPNGEWKWSGNTGEIHNLLQQGYRAIRQDGTVQETRPFQGGYLVDYGGGEFVPIQTVLGDGIISSLQAEALRAAGYRVPAHLTIVDDPGGGGGRPGPPGETPPGGNLANNGNIGNTGQQLTGDFNEWLRQLIQGSLNQGANAQNAYGGIFDDLRNALAFTRSGAEQSYNQGNELTNMLLGYLTPGLNSAMNTMNQSTGLSPEAMAALRLNATEKPENDYQQQVQQLKTELAQRGAFGQNMPGASDEIIRGYSPLLSARDSTRSQLLANTILADEQRKLDTLKLNRDTASSFFNTAAGLTTGLKNAYSPAPWLNANDSALTNILAGITAQNNAGFQGMTQATNLMRILQDMQPGSFRNTLLASILGTTADAIGTASNRPGFWSGVWNAVRGIFGGGNNSTSGTPSLETVGAP